MTAGVLQRLDRSGRNIVPGAVTLILILASMLHLPLPGYAPVAPQFGLAAVFYWAIHRPDLLRPSYAFAFGVVQDLMAGTPLGLTALVYVLTFLVVAGQRRFLTQGNFFILWFGFALAVGLTALVAWLAVSVLHLTLVPPMPVAFQVVLTISTFPLVAWACIKLHRAYLVVG